jgi:hypothetical protein
MDDIPDVHTRQDVADVILSTVDQITEVDTDEEGYITRVRMYVGESQKPVELYPATDSTIGSMVTD